MDKVVYTFEKNKFEEVRFQIKEYKGYDLIDLRIWTEIKSDKTKVPTPKGLSMNISHFMELKKGVEELEKALRENNMLPE